jgi:hypothetical protein
VTFAEKPARWLEDGAGADDLLAFEELQPATAAATSASQRILLGTRGTVLNQDEPQLSVYEHTPLSH